MKKVLVMGILLLLIGVSVVQHNNTTVKADFTEGLVGYWSFDEGNGTILHDLSGNGNDGVIFGNVTWTTGITGNAINFDGTDDWVDCGNGASLNTSTALTLAAWYKPTVSWSGAGPDPIIDKPINSSDGNSLYQYHLGVCGDLYPNPNANHLGISFLIDTDGTYNLIKSEENATTFNQWSFIVGTYDGTTMKLYIDSVLNSSINASGTITNYNQNLRIAKYLNASNEPTFLPGVIDEIRIYNRALTEDEIQFLYHQGINQPPFPPTIDGPLWGLKNVDYTFCISVTDPDYDNLYCIWDWDDGNISEWLGPYTSGQTFWVPHNWSYMRSYEIRVKLKDEHGLESNWSEPHIFNVYELKKVIFFGRFTNMTTEGDYITVEAVNLRMIRCKPFIYRHFISGEKMSFLNQYSGIIANHFLIGMFIIEDFTPC